MTAEPQTETDADYHGDYSHVSQSMLKVFADRRMTYYKTFVTREIPPQEASRKMDLGTMAHAALLEPHNVDRLLIEIPDDLLSGANKAVQSNDAKRFVVDARTAGLIPLKAKEIEVVRRIAKAIEESELGEWFGLPSKREHTIRWRDQESGIACRMKGDIIIEQPKFAIGIDLKTTEDASPSGFARVANSCGYDIQDAHYRAGITAETGKPCEFYFIVAEVSEPFSVAVHRIEDPAQSDERRRQLLLDLAACHESGHWKEPWEKKINSIKIWKRN